jgi:hypothetical protein
MSWSAKFDEPIWVNSKALHTLRDAASYIIALSPRESTKAHWQTAMACLISAAEKGGPLITARIAMLKAINAGLPELPPEPRRNAAKRYH